MRKAIIRFILLGLVGLTLAACMPRLVPPGGEFLGKRQVTFAVERDSIVFPAGTKPIRRLLIVVRMNDLEIYGLKIAFEKGEDYEIDYKGKFLANRDNEFFDLPGGARRIRRIDFLYRSLMKTARRAEVEFWGY
jgi:hypothetical protein